VTELTTDLATPSVSVAESLHEVTEQIDQTIMRLITRMMVIGAVTSFLIYGTLALMPTQANYHSVRVVCCLVLAGLSLTSVAVAKRWGLRHAVSFFSTAALMLCYATALAVGSGVYASCSTYPAVWIVIMSHIYGARAGVIATLVSIGGVFLLIGAQWAGLIPGIQASNTQPAITYGAVMVLVFTLLGMIVTQHSKLFLTAMQGIDSARIELQAKVIEQEKVQVEMFESQERLNALLEHAPMSVLVFDKDTGQLTYANLNALQAHGVSSLREIPALCACQQAPYRADDLLAHIRLTRDHGARQMRWRSQDAHGRDIWWDIKLDNLVLDGQPQVVTFGHNITPLVTAEHALIDHRACLEDQVRERTSEVLVQKHRLEAVIEAMPGSLSIRDLHGRYQRCNAVLEKTSGLSRHEMLGRTPHEIFPAVLADVIVQQDQTLLQGAKMHRFESAVPSLDGRSMDQLVTKVPLLDASGKPEAILTLSVDISEQKAMQRELAIAKAEAEQVASIKSNFLANMSHEIRTPLHGMLGMAQVGEHLSASSHEQAKDVFARITHSGQHLLGVINDILDSSKLDAGKLSLEDHAMNPLQVAQDAMAMVEERGRDKGLCMSMHCSLKPPHVLGDALRTRQILINLLSNAVKFTHEGEVSLSLEVRDGWLWYAVRDTGIGIRPDELARVFSAFEQADTTTSRRFGGTGLGLSISHQLAQLMGGSLTVQSAPGAGSIFTLSIPMQEADAQDCTAETSGQLHEKSGPNLQGLRVLAADDVDINRDILEALLGHEGAHVHSCENGAQAIDLVCRHGPGFFDVVLMDVQMPVMNGLQATEHIKKIEPDLPVVALTAHVMREEAFGCLQAGMVGHLAKPFEARDLVAAILRHARKAPQPSLPGADANLGLAKPKDTAFSPEAGSELASSLARPDADFDHEAALRRCSGNETLLRKLLVRFRGELPTFVDRCKAMHASHPEDPDEARRAAHTLKGTAGNLGLASLSNAAADLEHAIHARKEPAVELAFQAVAQSVNHHLEVMDAWLNEPVVSESA
jgi:PAS domain S-box-containing protein